MECRRLAEKERRPRSELRRRLLPLGIFFETAISAVVAKLLRDQAEALWKH